MLCEVLILNHRKVLVAADPSIVSHHEVRILASFKIADAYLNATVLV